MPKSHKNKYQENSKIEMKLQQHHNAHVPNRRLVARNRNNKRHRLSSIYCELASRYVDNFDIKVAVTQLIYLITNNDTSDHVTNVSIIDSASRHHKITMIEIHDVPGTIDNLKTQCLTEIQNDRCWIVDDQHQLSIKTNDQHSEFQLEIITKIIEKTR